MAYGSLVAPPRGERGLKYVGWRMERRHTGRRSPSWGAWIEMVSSSLTALVYLVAPPRGERGLK